MLLDILWHSLSYTCTIRSKKESFHVKHERKENQEVKPMICDEFMAFLSRKHTRLTSKHIHELIKKLFFNASHNNHRIYESTCIIQAILTTLEHSFERAHLF